MYVLAGTPKSNSLSNLPKRRDNKSMVLAGAAMSTMHAIHQGEQLTDHPSFNFSINLISFGSNAVNLIDTHLVAGAFCAASSNVFLKLDSLSPEP